MNQVQVKKEASIMNVILSQGEPVMTTEQLASFYGVNETNIKTNFSRNKGRFREGRHYFKISGSDLNDLRVTESYLQISNKTRSIMLWTERGALNHAKMIESDKAWDVFDTLVDCYFWRKRANRQKSAEQRAIGIQERHFETDSIKALVEYCIEQGMDKKKAAMYYSTFTRETYKALGVQGVERDNMNQSQLMHLAASERLIGESLEGSILNGIPCRECYYIAKDQMLAYASIVNKHKQLN